MAEIYEGAVNKGLEGVVACTTAISSIVDATLCYRGYTIEDLAANSTFEEVSFLLWNDRLPSRTELDAFRKDLSQFLTLDKDLKTILAQIPCKGVHPMSWLRTAVSLMAHYDKNAQNDSKESMRDKALRLMAQTPLLVAALQRLREGQPIIDAKPDKSIAWNLMYCMSGKEPDSEFANVMDTALILHADHELNCSAFAARVTASSLSDMYSSVVSAIGALKGPLHGGANEQVMVMLKEIGSVEGAKTWIKDALDRKEKVMGFGHRVYKNGDPRAKILREMSRSLTQKMGEPHWYEMSKVIDDTVQNLKGLLPNVDFYSATVYYSMGIPIDMYTPIFAASRMVGWIAHIFEQLENNRIYRPRGHWVGKENLKYAAIDKR